MDLMLKGVTLRGLEVFEALASHGSVAMAAEATGLSQPAVSQQISNLEKALGMPLLERGRRPMRLTPAGRSFLARAETALRELRMGQSELTVMDLSDLTALDIGLIDDFDHDLTPRLATALADNMSKCRFKLITAPSREISRSVADGVFHIAIAAHTGQTVDNVIEYPLVHDPFILVTPRDLIGEHSGALDVLSQIPMLRYAQDQLIAHQIEAHLSREGLQFEDRFEIGSHQALMAMAARRIGWTITTALGYMRAVRYHDELSAYALPFAGFSRTITLFARNDVAEAIPAEVAQTMRRLVQGTMIAPAIAALPWLEENLRVIEP